MTSTDMQAIDPRSVKMNPTKLSEVCNLFYQQQQTGAFPGGQLVIKR